MLTTEIFAHFYSRILLHDPQIFGKFGSVLIKGVFLCGSLRTFAFSAWKQP